MPAEVCKTCRFLFEDAALRAIGEGFCRRYPPQVAGGGAQSFPRMQSKLGWCGEHQPKVPKLKVRK